MKKISFRFICVSLLSFCVPGMIYGNPNNYSGKEDTLKQSVNDCSKAIEITDTLFGPSSIKTYLEGNPYVKGEFYDESGNWLQKGWYRFTAAETCYIAFDIIPESSKDDYDFFLFKYTGKIFCEKIKTKNIRPVRKCLSQDFSNAAKTGLSANGKWIVSEPGYNPPYCSGFTASAGETYYLYIAFAPSGGHHPFKIHFHFPLKSFADPIILKNVLFETASAKLLESSFPELDQVVLFLNSNPEMQIIISGHTDKKGNEAANITLSRSRAGAVYSYLASKGIDKKRMSYEGHGSSNPIDSNDTEEGRQKNRRVEFILK